jgi:hypothetical protein
MYLTTQFRVTPDWKWGQYFCYPVMVDQEKVQKMDEDQFRDFMLKTVDAAFRAGWHRSRLWPDVDLEQGIGS